MSAKARLVWFFAHRLSLAGLERPAAAQAVVRTPGAQSRRPCRAVDRARGRRRGAEDEEEEDEEEEPAARAPRKKAAPQVAVQEIRQVGFPGDVDAGRAESHRPPAAVARPSWKPIRAALEGVLGDFGVRGEIAKANPGPVVTLYELEPAPGIKSSRVIGLADDIARSMSALSARVAVVPGRNAIGIELPNAHREKVYLRELLTAKEANRFRRQAAALPRQDHRRRSRHHRSRPHAAHADRRHHRLRQIGRDQHHDPEPGLPAAARTSAG